MKTIRNAPCPCGSGKKCKTCCMNKQKEVQPIEDELDKITLSITEQEKLLDFINNFHKLILERRPHIKEYKKTRRIHGEIMESMMKYFDDGKFKLEVTNNNIREIIKDSTVSFYNSFFLILQHK